MQIRTQRLSLRPLEPADAASIRALAGDFDVARMTGMLPHPYSERDALAWIDRAGQGEEGVVFAVARDGALIGCSGYMPMDAEHAEVGYWIGKPFWGEGFATEAVRARCSPCFRCAWLCLCQSGPFHGQSALPARARKARLFSGRGRDAGLRARGANRCSALPTGSTGRGQRARCGSPNVYASLCRDACKMVALVLIPSHAVSRFRQGLCPRR